MPIYFTSSKFKTWQRSLNLWGFETLIRGDEKGACRHPDFVRGKPQLCKKMTRVKIKGAIRVGDSPTVVADRSLCAVDPEAVVEEKGSQMAEVVDPFAIFKHDNVAAEGDLMHVRALVARRSADVQELERALIQRLSSQSDSSRRLNLLALQNNLFGPSNPLLNGLLPSNQLANCHLLGAGAGLSSIPQQVPNGRLSAVDATTTAIDMLRHEESQLLQQKILEQSRRSGL